MGEEREEADKKRISEDGRPDGGFRRDAVDTIKLFEYSSNNKREEESAKYSRYYVGRT